MGGFGWCLHCERAAPWRDWDRTGACPYADCDGSTLDLWRWSEVRIDEDGNPRYEEVPVPGIVYPLYPG